MLNSSGKPQLLAAMQTDQTATVIVNQDQCFGPEFVDLQHDAKNEGWALVVSSANKTVKEGKSCGVAIVAKHGINIGSVAGSLDHSGSQSPGRIAAAWMHVGPDKGMVVISVYLVHTVGPTPINRSVVQRALSIAKSYGSPWIIARVFNMSPSIMVHSWDPMLEQADAYVFAPSEPTHRPRSGAHEVFVYALCSSSAAD